MLKNFLRVFTLMLIVISFNSIQAQSFGFGCLGLSGFYAGVSEFRYETPGIDEYANSFSAFTNAGLQWKDIKFNKGTGYRIGANIFRARWDKIFISAKGYYQFLKEEQSNIIDQVIGQLEFNYQLTMNHWGLGVDIGVPLFSIIDWKIIEGGVAFYNSELTCSQFLDNKLVTENKFSPDKIKMGYYLGTGLILQLVPDYISIEGSAGFNFLQIDQFTGSADSVVPVSGSNKNAVEKGGWSGTIQLNVGFPL